MSHPLQNMQLVSATVSQYLDLLEDLVNGKISFADAESIAASRQRLDIGLTEDLLRQQNFEVASRKATAGGNMYTKGMGHRSLGAKCHGKSTVCTPGAGGKNPKATRLYKLDRDSVAAIGAKEARRRLEQTFASDPTVRVG